MKPALAILYVDNHLLALAKPAGLPTVPDASGDASLYDLARAWVRAEFAKPGEAFLGIVHRLDRPVSGVVLFARTSKAAARLSAQFRERRARKTYWGVGEGERTGSGVVEQWLAKHEAKNRVQAFASERAGAQHARTVWTALERGAGRTLYRFEPETGRPHQLRLAAVALGTPLCGDLKYGARGALPDRSLALHARSLLVAHPTRAQEVVLEAAAPALAVWDFATCRAGGTA